MTNKFPRIAYLECSYIKYNESDNSSCLKFRNAEGNIIFGFFHKEAIIMSEDGNGALLEVMVDNEYLSGNILIHFLQKTPIYGIPATGNQMVKREQIVDQAGMERPN